MPIIKPVQQAPPIQPNNEVEQLREENTKLQGQIWIDSLSDDKKFRLELIRTINEVSESIKALTAKIETLTLPEGE